MSLDYATQYRIAEGQPEFPPRVAAALFATAVAQFIATPLADPIKQAQRMSLIKQVLEAPGKVTVSDTFKWLVVMQPDLTVDSDITDAYILTKMGVYFDIVSQILLP